PHQLDVSGPYSRWGYCGLIVRGKSRVPVSVKKKSKVLECGPKTSNLFCGLDYHQFAKHMRLDWQVCSRARLTRDARFDGKFFIGVLTTGVYCRPICPARTAKEENVRYFPNAAAAAEAGFRPCLRCRPECSPGTPAWMGTPATVSRALRLINESGLEEGVDSLAGRLGVSAR